MNVFFTRLFGSKNSITPEQLKLMILDRTFEILAILMLFFVFRYLANRMINRVVRILIKREGRVSEGRLRTLGSLIRSVVFYLLVFITGVMILKVFGIDPTPVLTAAGVVGLAVGFGAQKLVRDIIAGFFIVLENQYAVGEYVTIGAITGTVEEFGMRVTQLRDDLGKLVIIANGDIVLVINHSRGPIQAIIEISVAPDSDASKVRASIDAAGFEVEKVVEGVASTPKAAGITLVDSTKITFRVTGEVKAGRQESVQAALREAIRAKFIEDDIKFV